jgi:hypothetical protein
MKRTTCYTSWVGLALSAALGCDPGPSVPPPVGGQSGDDGGGHDPDPEPPGPITPGLPEPPCEPEVTALGAEGATVFGATVQGLIDGLALDAETPLFWVPFDEVAPATFAPGPGQSALTLGIALRAGAAAQQTVQVPEAEGAVCPRDVVSMPVQLALATADGALDEHVDATLEFTNAKVAHLTGRFLPDEVAGSFAFVQLGAPSGAWQAQAFDVDIDLWPGGSRGSIHPVVVELGPPHPPAPSGPPGVIAAGAPTAAPLIPDHWGVIAVWPRREVCPNDGRAGVVFDASDPLIGVSPLDVIDAVEHDALWSLAAPEGSAALRVTIEAPSGLVCVSSDGPTLELDVRATLRVEDAPPGSSLEHLDASTILRLGARAAGDGSGLVELHWQRRDAVWSEARDAFEAATGVELNAPEEYRDIWWSWYGQEQRADASAPWNARAELVVSSMNAEQAADVARIVAQGGPGAGISVDEQGFPILPGDSLIDAELSP